MAMVLGALWAWDVYDKILVSMYSRRYKTIPLPIHPTLAPSDMSIVVPTIDTESTFTECVRLWLKSNPREIIIVTVQRYKTHVEQLVSSVLTDKIIILIAPMANKRQQIAIGVKAAKGKIIALVDDDAYWGAATAPYLLAPFENEAVGSVAGLQSPEIPLERQDPRVITVWEAAAAFDMFKLNQDQPMRFAADGGCWALVGRTMFVRASILQDQRFIDAFTHQIVNNIIANGADDVYVTEWVLDHKWKICVQNAPEAEITADVKRDRGFLLQNLRWERGNFRSFFRRIFVNPGYWAMRQTHPYLTRKLVEKLTRPIWSFAYVAAWLRTLWTAPWLGVLFMLWMVFGLHGWVPTYRAFAKKYPYMAGKTWALFCMESVAPILDIYAFATMNDDRWLTRTADAQQVKDHHVESTEKIQNVGERLLKLTPLMWQKNS